MNTKMFDLVYIESNQYWLYVFVRFSKLCLYSIVDKWLINFVCKLFKWFFKPFLFLNWNTNGQWWIDIFYTGLFGRTQRPISLIFGWLLKIVNRVKTFERLVLPIVKKNKSGNQNLRIDEVVNQLRQTIR